MTWIRLEVALPRHPKTRRLSRALALKRRDAVGLVVLLWTWAIEYAADGDLSNAAPEDLADAVDWRGDCGRLVDGLVEAGFVDRDGPRLRLHDWDEFQGHLLVKRQANAERQARWREKSRNALRNGTPITPITPLRNETNVTNETYETNGTKTTKLPRQHSRANGHREIDPELVATMEATR